MIITPELVKIAQKQITVEDGIIGKIIVKAYQSHNYFIIAFNDEQFIAYNIYTEYVGDDEYEANITINPIFDHTSLEFIKSLREAGVLSDVIANKQIDHIKSFYAKIQKKNDLQQHERIRKKYDLKA